MKYITWGCECVGEHKKHPNTNNYWAENQDGVFTETAFTDGDIYIGVLDSDTVPETCFNLVEKTEEETNTLLNTWYSGDVTVSNYVFTDNRPILEI